MIKQQPNYELKPAEPLHVHAQQIPVECKICIQVETNRSAEIKFAKDDWLITYSDGIQKRMSNQEFGTKFQLIRPASFDKDFYPPNFPPSRLVGWAVI